LWREKSLTDEVFSNFDDCCPISLITRCLYESFALSIPEIVDHFDEILLWVFTIDGKPNAEIFMSLIKRLFASVSWVRPDFNPKPNMWNAVH
jgi:hypothetical protein